MSVARAEYHASHQGSWRDTRPELELERQLQERGFRYEKQKHIGQLCVDFYLPQQNLVIEVDGCYYHGCQEHCPGSQYIDGFVIRRQRLNGLGYDAIRIWEHELVTRPEYNRDEETK